MFTHISDSRSRFCEFGEKKSIFCVFVCSYPTLPECLCFGLSFSKGLSLACRLSRISVPGKVVSPRFQTPLPLCHLSSTSHFLHIFINPLPAKRICTFGANSFQKVSQEVNPTWNVHFKNSAPCENAPKVGIRPIIGALLRKFFLCHFYLSGPFDFIYCKTAGKVE